MGRAGFKSSSKDEITPEFAVSAIDLRDYVAGGYFILKDSSEGFQHSTLLPERVISVSGCIGDILEPYWGWNLKENQAHLDRWGISADLIDQFRAYSTDRHEKDYGFPGVFYSLDAARHFAVTFLSPIENALLIGIALPRNLVDTFLATNTQPNEIPYGVNHMLSRNESLALTGTTLGFEIVSYNINPGHSWLCSGLEKEMHELFGIKPNRYGLIDTYAEARQVYDWIAEDKQQGKRAEPEPYYPWLIVHYPLM